MTIHITPTTIAWACFGIVALCVLRLAAMFLYGLWIFRKPRNTKNRRPTWGARQKGHHMTDTYPVDTPDKESKPKEKPQTPPTGN